MSIAKWCENNGINKGQYHYWNSRINTTSNAENENIFTEITPILTNIEDIATPLSSSQDFQVFFKNVKVIVPSNFNQVSLAGLMKVLQEL